MSDEHRFAAWAGVWRGTGHGEYPTIDDFIYGEELTIELVPGRPLAHWRSVTRDAASGEPRHAESGFLRATDDSGDAVEFVVAHGFGIVETSAGSCADGVLDLVSTGLLGTSSATRVDEVRRRYQLTGKVLGYEIAMAAVEIPLTHHLRAELHRP